MADEKALEMQHIFKSFGGVHALKDVSFCAYRGKVNVLMGENGAGKSTLMRVLAGAITGDSGVILVDGKEVQISRPQDSKAAGVAMIYQELNLVPQMTVEANMNLGDEWIRTAGFVRIKDSVKRAQALLDEYDLDIDAKAEVSSLSIAEQQMLEIAKALASDAKIIVMDEPTSSLTTKEVNSLFKIINRLTSENRTVIYISHRMEEVFQIGDYVSVMRDGTFVGVWPIAEVTQADLIASMVGRNINNMFPKETVPIGEEVLSVRRLTHKGLFEDVSFTVRAGEILGFSGLVGAGRTEVALTIFGALHADAGEVFLHGEKIQIRSPKDAIDKKIVYIPEDRKTLALDLRAKISDNIALGVLDKLCSRLGFVDQTAEKKLCEEQKVRFRIKTPDMSLPANSLSGGNQQKVVLAKWLSRDVDVLILDEPTRGIDVGSKEEIYRLIVELAREGKAIIMISSELPEVLGMSDTVMVMYEGRKMAELPIVEATQERVLAYSFGHKDGK
ncbi:MAG: sugar ABC transporter ATP-binding protein [Lachnospiraceae bacterium]|jgi:ABC-type sugar transport system ATPase subunit|nr:sugar ABC transporter ATP-binding protein [Lachnospiraceae bacterium]